MYFAERVTFIFLTLLTTLIGSCVGGTVLFFIWEDSLTAMFPTAVSAGVLAATLTWWQCVKIVWVFSTLLKTTVETKQIVKEKLKLPLIKLPANHKPGDHTTGI